MVHGASGFVGRLVAGELVGRGVRVALSGRSAERLAAVRDELGVDWPLLVTDAADEDAVERLARSADVVATTVGPYGKYGLPLVKACAEVGTAYCDLTGETSFVRASAEAAHERARATGARIVHSAGFDSVPADLGVFLLHRQVGELGRTVGVLAEARGGISGGTVDSVRAELDAGPDRDPYSLSPDRSADPSGKGERDPLWPVRDPIFDRWLAPNPFGPHDSRIVRRTNALLGHAYGPGFRYSEHLLTPAGPVGAAAVTVGLGAFAAGLRFAPSRALLDRMLPKPGDGPSERTRAKGSYRFEVRSGNWRATLAADLDPGYGGTAAIFTEVALALAEDEPSEGGVLTPVAAVGESLVRRLSIATVEELRTPRH